MKELFFLITGIVMASLAITGVLFYPVNSQAETEEQNLKEMLQYIQREFPQRHLQMNLRDKQYMNGYVSFVGDDFVCLTSIYQSQETNEQCALLEHVVIVHLGEAIHR